MILGWVILSILDASFLCSWVGLSLAKPNIILVVVGFRSATQPTASIFVRPTGANVLPLPADRPPHPLGSALDRLNHFLTAETVRHAWLGLGAMAMYAPIPQYAPIFQTSIAGTDWQAIAWIQPESVPRLRTHAEAEQWQVIPLTHPGGPRWCCTDRETQTALTLIPVSDCAIWADYGWALLKRREVLARGRLGLAAQGDNAPIWIATPEDLLLWALVNRGGPGFATVAERQPGEQPLDEQEFDEQELGAQEFDEQPLDEQKLGAQEFDEQEFDEQEFDEQQLGDWWRSLQECSDSDNSNGQRRLNICYVQEWSDRLGVAACCDRILSHANPAG